ncbi:hypothetical protein [Sulfurimonas sp. NW9]|uniref:hypothetical protein n=1 Tax=Sulfurimonas sp. NW9 TaxID=2922728 RepID=UPI003DA9606D
MNNVVAQKTEIKFSIVFSVYALIKFYLRGLNSVSYAHPLAGKLQQAKMGERIALEVHDPEAGSYTVVAVRKSPTKAIIITGWRNDTDNNIIPMAKELIEILYKVIFGNGLSSWDIKKEKKKWLSN